MRPEVEKFWNDAFGGLAGFIRAGARRGVNKESIEVAAAKLYDDRGKYRQTMLGQRLIPTAKLLNLPGEDQRGRLRRLERVVIRMHRQMDRLGRPWWIKIMDWYVGN